MTNNQLLIYMLLVLCFTLAGFTCTYMIYTIKLFTELRDKIAKLESEQKENQYE